MKSSPLFILLFFLAACSNQKPETTETATGPEPEAYSFSGKPLFAKPMANRADSVARMKSDSTITAIIVI